MTTAIIIIWVLCGITAAYIAREKDRNPYTFFFAGLLLGVFGIVIAFAAKSGYDKYNEDGEPARYAGYGNVKPNRRTRSLSRHW